MRLSGLLRLAALLQAAALGMRTGLPQAGPTARRVVLRRALGAAGGAAAAALGSAAPAEASLEGTDWPLWPALPIAPYGQRKTVMREAVPGKVWTFDQMLGIFYVHVPIRMTVVAMEQGGLFVYAPVAPTAELRAMLQPLVDAHGPVKHVVLPSAARTLALTRTLILTLAFTLTLTLTLTLALTLALALTLTLTPHPNP